MSIKRLVNILSRPDIPNWPKGSKTWDEIENDLGTVLPQDYKDFIEVYGLGEIDYFIWIFNPFTENDFNLFNKVKIITEGFASLRNEFPEYYTHNVFPHKAGILPFGQTLNGDQLFWLTEGSPEQWPIVVYETRSSDYCQYNMSLTSFLADVLSNKLICEVFPEDFPSPSPVYRPFNIVDEDI